MKGNVGEPSFTRARPSLANEVQVVSAQRSPEWRAGSLSLAHKASLISTDAVCRCTGPKEITPRSLHLARHVSQRYGSVEADARSRYPSRMLRLRAAGVMLLLAATPACSSGEREAPALSGVTAISTGFDSNCALINDGSVRCWGFNHNGELGNDTLSGEPLRRKMRGNGFGGALQRDVDNRGAAWALL